jgi:hypothetical protein
LNDGSSFSTTADSPGATQGNTVNALAQMVSAYYTVDMQLSYQFGAWVRYQAWPAPLS